MNVNEKGSIGLIEVIRDLTKKGYECFTPLHDYSAVDLLVMDKHFQVKRLQIKYRKFEDDNVLELPFNTVVNGKRVPIDFSAIDGWAVYIPDVETVCYIPKNIVPEGNKSFRIRKVPGAKTINLDKRAVKLYTEYTKEEVIWTGG